MKKRTQKEVDAEIKALEACKSYAPRRTMFGDDNHRGIDLQIKCLRWEIDTTAEEFFEDYTDDEQSVILAAQHWQEGEEDESPSSGWDTFKPKTKKAKKK